MIVIGELRDSVALPDIAGAPVVPAAVVALSAAERQHVGGAATHKIYIHWRDDIAPGMRAEERGETYAVISSADRDGRQACLEITAQIQA